MRRSMIGWGAAIALATAAAGCDSRSCTLAAFEAGLRLHFSGPEGGPLPEVTLEIVLNVDGDVYSTVCGRPDPSGFYVCEDAEGSGDHRIEAEATSRDTFSIQIWRSEGGDDRGPETVAIQAMSGDAPLVDTTFEPTYESDEPNGEGCGVVDHVVEETIVIDVGG